MSTPTDIETWLARARLMQPNSPEVAPGVTEAEAIAAAGHVLIVQGGFSTPEIEAKRLSEDRAKAARIRPLPASEPPSLRGPRPTLVILDVTGWAGGDFT